MSKKFRLIKSTLYNGTSDIASTLRIGNNDYIVAFNYFGNYLHDRENDQIEMQKLAFVVKSKPKGYGMPMVYSVAEDDIFINLVGYPSGMLDDEGVETLLKCLETTKETKAILLKYIRMIRSGKTIDIDNEFDPPIPGFYTPPDVPDRFKDIVNN